jgi:hypothetical protein
MRCRSAGFGTANQTQSATQIDYAKFYSRSHDAVVPVYDAAGNVIETHEHTGNFREF